MATYTLHLGFNWNSPVIGSFWSSEKVLENYRFLQYALANNSGSPAWFRFSINDVLNILIWDQTSASWSSEEWGTSQMECQLSMSFGPLDAGTTQTYTPSTLVNLQSGMMDKTATVNDQLQPYLKFDTATPVTGRQYGETPPWGPCPSYSAGSITFNNDASYKMSFYLKTFPPGEGNTDSRIFISDPEVIVGSQGEEK